MAEPILTARKLVKRYGRVTALDHADFDLMPGEILAVIGDNGAGKSSMIKAISGAVTPDEGEIRLDGKPIQFTSPMQARALSARWARLCSLCRWWAMSFGWLTRSSVQQVTVTSRWRGS